MAKTNVTTMKVTKKSAQNFLADVPEGKAFWSHDGQSFRNLEQLAQGLFNMNDETYLFHIREDRSDFATWVDEVVGDLELARDLNTNMTRMEASQKVLERVNYLSSIK